MMQNLQKHIKAEKRLRAKGLEKRNYCKDLFSIIKFAK